MIDSNLFIAARKALIVAAIAAFGGVVASLVLGLIAWASTAQGSPVDALGSGIIGWLFAHGGSIVTAEATVTVTPLGALAVLSWWMWTTVARVVDDELEEPVAFGLFTVLLYGTFVVIVATISRTDQISIVLSHAAMGAALVAAIGVIGALRGVWWPQLPERAQAIVLGALRGLAVVAIAAFALTLISLFVHRATFVDMWTSLDAGFIGSVSMLLFNLAFLPNIAAWAGAVMLGPGFALGVDTNVDLWGSQLAGVPAVPILAAVPPPGSFPAWVFVLACVPLIGGIVAGMTIARSSDAESPISDGVLDGALAGASAGIVLATACMISGGSIGPGLMAQSGPPLWPTVFVAPLVMGLMGVLGAAGSHARTLFGPPR